ncbi:MAG: OadG family transporter subunit [Nitrospinae bacterium]|nr:OadG family transporter subunit [Nitrospinota bacterium]
MDSFIPGILLTTIGMGVVFGSLVVLMVVILLLERFVGSGRREASADAVAQEAAPESDDLDVVLAAAAGYFLETETPEVYVPPVRRNANSVWARTARAGHLSQRRRR